MLSSTKNIIFTLTSLLYLALLIAGIWLDQQTALSQLQLMIAFHSAGIVGLVTTLLYLRRSPAFYVFWHYLLLLLLAYVVWRIAYFPILVLAGYSASLGEAMSLKLSGYSLVYPLFLLTMAAMNAASLWLASQVLKRVLRPKAAMTRQETTLLATSIPLALLAITISFTQATDWHAIPDTSYIDEQPLPEPALPDMNPYHTVLADPTQQLNWRQRILFHASAITYDLIPEQTQWARIVRGTLEHEFVNTSNVSTEFCVKVHYRAFRVAHPFLQSSPSSSTFSGEGL